MTILKRLKYRIIFEILLLLYFVATIPIVFGGKVYVFGDYLTLYIMLFGLIVSVLAVPILVITGYVICRFFYHLFVG